MAAPLGIEPSPLRFKGADAFHYTSGQLEAARGVEPEIKVLQTSRLAACVRSRFRLYVLTRWQLEQTSSHFSNSLRILSTENARAVMATGARDLSRMWSKSMAEK